MFPSFSPRRLAVSLCLTGLLAAGFAGTAAANSVHTDSANPESGHWCGFAVPMSSHYDIDHKIIGGTNVVHLNQCLTFQDFNFTSYIPFGVRQPVSFLIQTKFLKDFRYGRQKHYKIGSHDFGGGPDLSSSENGTNVKGHFYYREFFKGTVQTGNLTERLYAYWVGYHCADWSSTHPYALTGCTY